jgi:hypothetical protein
MIHLPFQAVDHSSTSHRSPKSKFQSDALGILVVDLFLTAPEDRSMHPPSYKGLRKYAPGSAVLAALGVGSVDDMVDQINQSPLAAGRFPISQGDYPGSKATFEKPGKEFRAIHARVEATRAPS